jgi:hypothetical protein
MGDLSTIVNLSNKSSPPESKAITKLDQISLKKILSNLSDIFVKKRHMLVEDFCISKEYNKVKFNISVEKLLRNSSLYLPLNFVKEIHCP